jgi:selenide,water dikinase
MAHNSQVGMELHSASVPLFPKAEGFAQSGYCPAGLHRNREFYSKTVEFAPQVPEHAKDMLFDPQTSGGLLISLAPKAAESLLDRLHEAGVCQAAVIGEAVAGPTGRVMVD